MRQLSWLAATLAACTYHPRALESGGPVAIIGDGSPVYRAAAGANVFLDGTRSHAAEGGELGFSWRIGPGCTHDTLEPSSLLLPVVELASLASGGCQVSLTVTDEDNRSHTATASVELVTVGTYVGPTNCVNRDPSSELSGMGGQQNPWCSPLDGMAAAADFHVADVWIASGDFDVSTSLVVPGGVNVNGGLNPADSWRPGAERTELGLRGDARVSLEPGKDSLLTRVAIFRREDSTSVDLDLVTVHRSVEIADCIIGAASGMTAFLTTGPTAAAATARSVHVIAGPVPISVSMTDSTVVMPAVFGKAFGIVLDGREGELSAEMVNVVIVGDTDTGSGAALRTLATRHVELRQSHIIVNSISEQAGYVFGVLDGIAGKVGFDPARMDVACEQDVCFPSHGLTIVDTRVTMSSLTNVAGIALMGSNEASISGQEGPIAVFGADGVVGLWSYATDAVTVTAVSVLAESSVDDATQGFVVGYLDGAGELGSDGSPNSHSGGSRSLTLEGVVAGAGVSADRTLATVAGGIVLLGTRDSLVHGSGFNAATDSAQPPLVALGLWTLGTRNVQVDASYWWQDPARPTRAVHLAAAHADGWPGHANAGSVDLLVSDNQLGAELEATDAESLAACVLWSATAESALAGNTVGCAPSLPGQLFHGILTLETAGVDIDGNRVIRPPAADNAPRDGTMVGIRDGLTDVFGGSARLQVRRNWVFTGIHQLYESSVGIWIDHRLPPASDRRVMVVNNALLGAGVAEASRGILLDDAEAEVLNNTVYGGDCVLVGTMGECVAPLQTIAIEVHGAARSGANGTEVWLANNLIHPGFGAYAVSVLDGGATLDAAGMSIAEISPSVFKGNLLVVPPNPGTAEIAYYVGTNDLGDTVDITSPMTLTSILAMEGDPERFGFAAGPDPPLCTQDNVHIDSSHWNVDLLAGQASATFAPSVDIDGHARDPVSPDIGADEVDGTPCGGY